MYQYHQQAKLDCFLVKCQMSHAHGTHEFSEPPRVETTPQQSRRANNNN